MDQPDSDQLNLERGSTEYAVCSLELDMPFARINWECMQAVCAREHYGCISCGGPEGAAPDSATVPDIARVFYELKDPLEEVAESVIALLKEGVRNWPLRYVNS